MIKEKLNRGSIIMSKSEKIRLFLCLAYVIFVGFKFYEEVSLVANKAKQQVNAAQVGEVKQNKAANVRQNA